MRASFILAMVASVGCLAAATARAAVVVVTPSDTQGWFFSNADNSGTTGTGQFTVGPATPPLGQGSAQFTVAGTTSSEILASAMGAGTLLSTITTLGYSTYVTQSGGGSGAAPVLSFDIRYNGESTYSGRLVFDPGLLNGLVALGTWQTWDAETAKGWYFSRAPGNASCSLNNNTPCTLAQVETLFPNLTINNVIFKVGSGQTSFTGYVDAFQFGTAAGTTTVDFDVPEPASAALLMFGLAAAGFVRRRQA